MANNSIENIQPIALDDFIYSLQSQKLVSQVKNYTTNMPCKVSKSIIQPQRWGHTHKDAPK